MRTFYIRNLMICALLLVATLPLRAQVINEYVADHTGSDVFEFIEIFGTPNTDYSNLTLVVLEGDAGGSTGAVDAFFTVGTTDANGFWVTPFQSNEIENGSKTILLVESFSGEVGQDLDPNDDGSLNPGNVPWTNIIDDVAILDNGASDVAFSTVVLAQGFDGSSFTVNGASRIPNGTDTDSADDWVRNDFFLAGISGAENPSPDLGEAFNTPGAVNQAVPAGPIVTFDLTSLSVEEDAGAISIRVRIFNPDGNQTAVDVTLDGASTATSGDDFTFTPSTLNFAANDTTSQTLSLTVNEDAIIEGNETVVLRLTNITNSASIAGDSTFTLTIVDNDISTLSFQSTSLNVSEEDGQVTVSVGIENPSASQTAVDVVVDATSTATDGSDFTISPSTLSFAANDTTAQSVTITLSDDALVEDAETVVLKLRNPTNSALLGDSTFTLTIADNDVSTLSFTSTFQRVNESIGQVTVNVSIDNAVSTATSVEVVVDTVSSTASRQSDFELASSTTLNFAANDTTTQTLVFNIVDDNLQEEEEDIELVLRNPTGASILGEDSTLTIRINTNDFPITPIADFRNAVDADLNPTIPGDSIVSITGIIHGLDLRGGNGIQFTVIDGPNARDGMGLFATFNIGPSDLAEGDSVVVIGEIGSFNGLMQIEPTTLDRISQGNELQMPFVTDTLNEDTESRVIQFNNVTILDTSAWNGAADNNSSFNVPIEVNGNQYTLRIDSDVPLAKSTYAEVFGPDTTGITLRGIGSQFDNSDPRDGGYQLFVFNRADIDSPNQPEVTNTLLITDVNGGQDVVENAAFNVTVRVQDENGDPINVLTNTNVRLFVNTGNGAIGGSITGLILAGSDSLTISGVTYDLVETGVVLAVEATSGDELLEGASLPFNVVEDPDTSGGGVPTALPTTLISGEVNIFPNPSNGAYRMTISGEAQREVSIQVFSSQGELKLEDVGRSEEGIFNIDLNSLPAGRYILKLKVGNEIIARQVVKY